jgi:hypothetical protein
MYKAVRVILAGLVLVGFALAKDPTMDVSRDVKVDGNQTLIPRISWNPAAHSSNRAIIFYEDFEGGAIPAGWTVVDGNSDGWMWIANTYASGGIYPPNYGTYFAIYDDDDAGSGAPISSNEALYSPVINISGYTAMTFSYSVGYNDIGTYDFFDVYASFDGGTTWQTIAQYTADISAVEEFDLTSYLPASTVQFLFKYYETPSATWGWAACVDNITLETPFDHDVGVAAILSPVAGYYTPGSTVPVGAKIHNYGANTETDFYVNATLDGYSDSYLVGSLAPGADMDVYFDDWTVPMDPGIFTLEVCTDLAGDMYPDNDCMTETDITNTTVPGDIVYLLDVGTITGDLRLLGVEYVDGYFFCTGARDYDSCFVYILDAQTSALVGQFYQPSYCHGTWGWRDMCHDKASGAPGVDTLHASVTSNMDMFGANTSTPSLTFYSSFPGVYSPNRALAYDITTEHYWTGSFSSSIYEFDRTGALLGTYANIYTGIYGAAYEPNECANGPWLWWATQTANVHGQANKIAQMDPATGGWTGVEFEPELPAGWIDGIAGGLDYEGHFNGMRVLFEMVQGDPTDYIIGIYLGDECVDVEEETPIEPDRITMTVQNPIGSRANLSLSLPSEADVELSLYDVTGRMVRSIAGKYSAGTHSIRMDVSDLSTGVYLLNLDAGEQHLVKKLVLTP